MNIFILSEDPEESARMLCDQHIIKMMLESCQMLSTVCGGHPCKITHQNHPCTRWVGASRENYMWLWLHAREMVREYHRRWSGKPDPKCLLFLNILQYPPSHLLGGLTPFAQAMPDIYRNPCPVQAYRDFYRGDKVRFARWKKGSPEWFK